MTALPADLYNILYRSEMSATLLTFPTAAETLIAVPTYPASYSGRDCPR